jgi:pimeloyl-ACP methyl ester carboxylesterase
VIPFNAAYYAHHLRRRGRQDGAEDVNDFSPEIIDSAKDWLRQWPLDPGVAQGIGTMPLRQALGFLAAHLGLPEPVVERAAALFFPEVDRYLRGNTPHRTRVRAEVAATIAAAPTPRIVLAHSLGSVVTYEALCEYPHIDVELLVTLGSPLAMPTVVFNRLMPPPQRDIGERPRGVRRWVNIADVGDIIAIPRGGLRRSFKGVDDDIETSIHWADFHTVSNYLRTDALARTLREYVS